MHDTSRRPPLRQATKSESRIPASNVQDQSNSGTERRQLQHTPLRHRKERVNMIQVDGDLRWWFINQSKTVVYENTG
ncbi:hypothetical protein BS47DRAFT_1351681, partial [Hydnum rufescens UP504]